MIGRGVVGERALTLAQVLEILERRREQGELSYFQRLTYDYAQKFASLDAKRAEKLLNELLELGFKEHQAVALIDLMPETKEDVQLIFAKERVGLEEADIDKALELISKYINKEQPSRYIG